MTYSIIGLREVLEAYDGLIVDLWGVMHNGKALFPLAVAALRAAKDAGKSVTLLSNAPRRRAAALAALDRLNLSSDLFDDLVTSGEVAWQALNAGLYQQWGQTCFFFGAEKDKGIQDGLGAIKFTTNIEGATWCLNTGPDEGHTSAAPFIEILEGALTHQIPMVCANPDLIVRRGANTEICAGAVAKAYAQMGGQVIWFGKPYDTVYRAVYESCGLSASQLLAVGDSFKTDVRGANQQGMDVLYVNTGIHGAEIGTPINMGTLDQLATENEAIPTFVAEAFRP